MLYILGKYRSYEVVDWPSVDRLIFVCAGNICRSSLAHHYCLSKGVVADSYGLICPNGDPADPSAISFGAENDVSLEHHRTKNISAYEEKSGDMIIAMTPSQIVALEENNYSNAKLTLIGLWHPSKIPYLHDPYSTSQEYFRRCEQIVIDSSETIIRLIKPKL